MLVVVKLKIFMRVFILNTGLKADACSSVVWDDNSPYINIIFFRKWSETHLIHVKCYVILYGVSSHLISVISMW